ncbi:MAG: hypothetical protein F6K31_32890 [Symploca sp. SIO2G7]|nr:hypothetical protein [Symploca sp. SIO2G7]
MNNYPLGESDRSFGLAIALPLLIPFTFLHNHRLTTVLNHTARDAITYGSCAISYATAVGDRKPL